ncbi:PLP-dependent aspartate aminotransferase family protein [Flavobacteriaceae bacterium]|jgi:cystathionine beta-lyase|nr:PLP-dependent aspartate aminotransferase family protein [Flavobacteriaceae bacterium]
MKKNNKGENTICTHEGEVVDTQFGGSVSPIFVSTSYEYINKDISRYPRYFNTPNQEALCKKISALECSESAMIFGSGMAAISTTLLTFLSSGDHILLQKDIYGGTRNLVEAQFDRFNIDYTFTDDIDLKCFKSGIKKNTKVIYIETPSNPLLKIIDIEKIAQFAKSRDIITIIDNTFATPIIQKPILFGVDVVLHSATKYFGGHSDISAGAVAASQTHIDKIWNLAKNLGGNLSDYSVWLLERSMKTLSIRVKAQQKNAKKLAKYLSESRYVKKVYYPGLKNHPNHNLAKKQMKGYGAMISFEFIDKIDPSLFLTSLNLIKPSMSLAGVESTMLSPAETSHYLLTENERLSQGITNELIRFSVGIENKKDIIMDIEHAIKLAIK